MGHPWRSICACLYRPGRDGDGSTSGSPRAEARAWGDSVHVFVPLVSSPFYMFPNKQWKTKERNPLNKNKWIETFPRQLKQCARKGRDGFTLPKETLPMSRVFLSSVFFTISLSLNNTFIYFLTNKIEPKKKKNQERLQNLSSCYQLFKPDASVSIDINFH